MTPPAPDRCPMCRTNIDHPPAICPVCLGTFKHVAGVRSHLGPAHGIGPGLRAHNLAVDVARAELRGWPTEELRVRFSEVYQEGFA